jgi:hypothetical protein
METAAPRVRGRPVWVWVICIFYLFSAGFTLFSLSLVRSGSVQLTPAQAQYFENLTAFDYLQTFTLSFLTISGAIALFFLRKSAFYLFAASLAFNILLTIWHAATKGWVAALSGSGLVGALLGLAMVLVVYIQLAAIKAWSS